MIDYQPVVMTQKILEGGLKHNIILQRLDACRPKVCKNSTLLLHPFYAMCSSTCILKVVYWDSGNDSWGQCAVATKLVPYFQVLKSVAPGDKLIALDERGRAVGAVLLQLPVLFQSLIFSCTVKKCTHHALPSPKK
eukprot:1161304-Pelagomonas_calceolata.AAC.5